MMAESFERSLWSALTPPGPSLPPLEGAERADVAVIGGGLLGLSLALHLAERGSDVVVLEAEQAGFGASGRNTGFVVPWLKAGLGLEQIGAKLGSDGAERLLRFVVGSGDLLFSLIQRVGISCDAEPSGWLQPVLDEAGERRVEAQATDAAKLGATVAALDAEATLRATGVPGYRAALLVRAGGQINPLAYARGLAAAAMRSGARLRRGRARAIERAGRTWRIRVEGSATLEAGQVVLATNALVGALEPRVARSVLRVRSYQVATQQLDPSVQAWLLPGRQPLADLRSHTFALRWSPDGRLVTGGGMVVADPTAPARATRAFVRRLARLVPRLPTLRAEFAWNGVVAATGDFLPRLWELGPGLWAPIGCNGRGVAFTTAFGRGLAAYLATDDPAELPVAPSTPRPWRWHAAMQLGPSLFLAQARLRDWRAEGRAGR